LNGGGRNERAALLLRSNRNFGGAVIRNLFAAALVLAAFSAPALAQDMGDEAPAAQPTEPAPSQVPEGPEAAPMAPEDGQAQPYQVAPPVQSAGPSGQWVYTGQYGWVWMPFGQQYTYVPADTQAYPYAYVYYPAYGWRWVVAPWIYGWGPRPYWGTWGPRYFAWYSRPWFRVGGYWGWGGYRGWGHYHGWLGPRSWGSRGWHDAPAYYRNPHQGWHRTYGGGSNRHGAGSYGGGGYHGASGGYHGASGGFHGAAPSSGSHLHGTNTVGHSAAPVYSQQPNRVERHEAHHAAPHRAAGGRRH